MEQVLNFDDGIFVFETVMRVRNIETGIGQQLTLESLTTLLAEARARFFYSKGIKEVDAKRQGLIIDSLQLNMISRVHARDELLFEIGIEKMFDESGNIAIKVSRMYDGSLVAKAREHFTHYDYQSDKRIPLGSVLKEALNQQPFMVLNT